MNDKDSLPDLSDLLNEDNNDSENFDNKYDDIFSSLKNEEDDYSDDKNEDSDDRDSYDIDDDYPSEEEIYENAVNKDKNVDGTNPSEENQNSEKNSPENDADSHEKDIKNNRKATPKKKNKNFKNSFNNILQKMKEELHDTGEDSSGAVKDTANKAIEAPAKAIEKSSNVHVPKFLSFIWNIYKNLARIIFIPIRFILQRIPFIGRFLGTLQNIFPILLLLIIFIVIGNNTVPQTYSYSFPDNGSATLSDFSYDASSNTVSGKIKNDGEVIVKGYVTFEIYSIKANILPHTWFIPTKDEDCTSDLFETPANSSQEIKSTCKNKIEGSFPRVTGVVH